MSTEIFISAQISLRHAFVTACLLAVFNVEAASAAEWQQKWQVIDAPVLTVSATGIDVLVEPGSPNVIEAILESEGKALGGSAANIVHRSTDTSVTINMRARPFVGARFLRLRIRVPQNADLDLRTGSGSLSVRGVHGNLRLETRSGALDGDDLDGRLAVATRTGAARLRGRFDELNIRTRSGAIQAAVLPGSRLLSDWEVQSRTGSVSIRLPSSLSAEIQARTAKGRIHSDLPLVTRGMRDEESLRGKLNGGGATLLVWSDRGSIRLSAS